MEEAWRIPMGVSAACGKSTEYNSRTIFQRQPKSLDFDDVFGGPPRTLFSRQADFNNFYDHIFLKPEGYGPAKGGGRNLPAFRIPKSEEFVGVNYEEVWRCKSKNNSRSTSEDSSPFQPAISDDDTSLPVYASILRPSNVPSKWNTSPMMHEVRQRHQDVPDFSCGRPSFFEKQSVDNEHIGNFESMYFSFSRMASSPESMSRGAYSYSSVKMSVEDLELNYPSSIESSLGQNQDARAARFREVSEGEEDDDETMSSYVIEINSNRREETDEGVGVEEAIAWAKESFHSHSWPEEWSMRQHKKELSADLTERSAVLQFPDGRTDGCESLHLQGDVNPNKLTTEEQRKLDECEEMELLEEDIKLWSSGKERNIKLLLSTLHDILWPTSGWHPVPVAHLNGSSHVKKAYQKARLCLHPDKLQQRGATILQKYTSEKAFSILQEAWEVYISQDMHHFS